MSGRLKRITWQVVPAWIWLAIFILAPLTLIVLCSFLRRGTYGQLVYEFGISNYPRAFDPLYLKIFWNSIWLAWVTTVSCLVLGFPLAQRMVRTRGIIRTAIFVLILVPFWTSLVVRAYAIKLLIPDGPFSVWVGMVSSYLPFMVLPLYASLEKFDHTLLDAARDLGAKPWRVFWEVLVPGNRAGILAGIVFVFAPALGEFVIPDLLGGAQVMLVGNLITEQFLKARDWPFGSSLSVILMSGVLISLGGYRVARSR